MITPISNNLNTVRSLSSIERPRIPGRNNASDSVSFKGKGGFKPGKVFSGIKGFFGKAATSVRKGASRLIHSKAVQAVKKGAVKGFHKTVSVVAGIPKAIGGFFSKIGKKFSKKA